MPEPLVTTIIPVHNHVQWVNEAVDSVIYNSYPRKKIVLVDDGSEDGSAEAVIRRIYRPRGPAEQGAIWACFGKIMNTNAEILVLRASKAGGPSFARNTGIRFTFQETDIYAFLDSDDTYSRDKISKSVELLAEPDVAAAYSDYECLHPDGLRVVERKQPFSREVLIRECIVNMDSLIKKEVFAKVGLFDETLRCCEDYDLWLRIAKHFMIAHIPEVLLTIRVGNHSSSTQVSKEIWNQCYQKVMVKNGIRRG